MSFKACTCCRTEWRTREDLLADPDVVLAGYQVDFEDLDAGLFLFNHSCRTTFAMEVELFKDLHEGPFFAERLGGTAKCPGYCLHKADLRPCPARCECSWVRAVVQKVARWPKRT